MKPVAARALVRPVSLLTAIILVLLIGLPATWVGADNKKKGESVGQHWQQETEIPRPPRRGKPQSPAKGFIWVPPKCDHVRGLIVAQKVLIEKRFMKDPIIRKLAEEENLALVYFDPGFDALFNWEKNDSGKRLEAALKDLATKSGHPEVEHAPMLTLGHSTAGIFARNVAYWKPDRAIGVIHIKSGNMHQHIVGDSSIVGVPFVAINGEREEFGPEGGMKGGLRKNLQRETQWVMIGQAILHRRAQNRNYLMSLIVHPGGSHTSWNDELTEYCALFIRKAVAARVPKDRPKPGEGVKCLPLKAESGWLTDAEIKAPRYEPAPYDEYKGDKSQAFWHLDKELALATYNYHKGRFKNETSIFTEPDPPAVWREKKENDGTGEQPAEKSD